MAGERGLIRVAASVFLGVLLFIPGILSAQNTGSVSGRVVDAASLRPLADAQIMVVGTGLGTLSNAEGAYIIQNVPPGEITVRVLILGYGAQEETVNLAPGDVAHVDFSLGQDAIALDEIVVTGLGKETERRRLSTSLDVISTEEISQVPVTTIDQLLQGRVAGASVNAQSAQPGSASLINFRGVSSVYGAQTPVVYVDGVRVDNDMATAGGTGGEQSSALADLLTSDIERIEVTRGGAASTLYGSDAATGVIQIFTKKGQISPPRFTARAEVGMDQPELKYMFDTKLTFPDLVEAGEVSGSFMEDNYWQKGLAQNYYLAVDGGNAQVTYSIGARIQDEEGVQPKNNSTVYSLRGGIQATVTDDFRMNFSGNFTRSSFDRLFNGTAIADPLTTFEVGDALYFSGAGTLQEAYDIFLMPEITETVSRFIFSSGFNWDVSDNLFLRANAGVDYRANEQRELEPIGFTPGEVKGEIERYQREFSSVSFDAAASWSQPVGEDFSSDLTVGVQGYRNDESIFYGRGTEFALPGAPDIDEAGDLDVSETNTERFTGGVYAEEQFDLWQKLTVNAGVRFDASTAFGDDISTEAYPKAGLSYLVSDDDWFGNAVGGWWNDMKVRLAYGETGKPPGPFDKDRSFGSTSFRSQSAPRFDNPGNEDLKPERTSTLELGFDASLFDNRVGIDFTWYDATTTDALFFVPEQPTTGEGTQLRNVGEISNKGIEVAWSIQVLNRPNLAWTLGGTFQTVDNEVTDMGGAADFSVDTGTGDFKRVTLGRPVGAWYVETPVDNDGPDGIPNSGDDDGKLDGYEPQFTGSQATPDKSGSFNTSLRLGTAWTITSRADWAAGYQVHDWGSMWATYNYIYRREEIEGVPFPIRHDLDGNEIGPYGPYQAISAFIYDGDWFKWRELSVRYTMPEEWAGRLGATRGSIYGSIRNIWIWSRTDMVDPELNGMSGGGLALGGESSTTASPPRKFRFGVEFVF
ncbi:MAG: TonB-dependent receptor [Gemmatimonadota bacterium]|jgi:outer membrane receptor protein involved in Fe transport